MMLVENIRKYYKADYNCAETLILAGNETYGLGLDEKAVKLMAGFGGGCGCGHFCGALAGALGILSILTIGERAHITPNFGPVRAEFMAKYEEKLGSFLCSDLKPKYRTEENGCLKTCELTGEVLAAYIAEKGLVK